MAAKDTKDATAAAPTEPSDAKGANRKASLEAAKKLEWKFAQRADASELVDRGIVSEEYEEVLHGNKDVTDAQIEHKRHGSDVVNKIDKVYKMGLRPSADDVEAHGIAPQGSLVLERGHENDDAVARAENEKKAAKQKLAQKFEQRMKPDEAVARHIIDEDTLSKDYDQIKNEHDSDKAKIASKLAGKLGQRPDAHEMVSRGITEDEKEVGPDAEDYDKVEKAKKQEKQEHVNALNNWKRPSPEDVVKTGVISNEALPTK